MSHASSICVVSGAVLLSRERMSRSDASVSGFWISVKMCKRLRCDNRMGNRPLYKPLKPQIARIGDLGQVMSHMQFELS